MAAVTGYIPAARKSRIAGALGTLGHRAGAHLKATGARLSGSILTAAGLACADTGAFLGSTIAGWVVTGASVLLLDWVLE